MSTHEDYSRRPEMKVSSNRTVGLVLGAFFFLVALKPVLNHLPVRLWALVLSLLLGLLALAVPGVLGPLNKAWTGLAIVLHKIMTPLVTGILFFLVFTPAGILRRWFGKDSLRLRPQPSAESYWVVRTPPGPAPNTMEQQF
jgi:hypothetical protein